MIVDIDVKTYKLLFPIDPHPFLKENFLSLNEHKVDNIYRLVDDIEKPTIGLIVGLKNNMILSPFSAPFGGFHFSHQLLYISVINNFIKELKLLVKNKGFDGIQITLPPDIYHQTINSKFVNSLFYHGFKINRLDITNWVDLDLFENKFGHRSSREYLKQAINNGLNFHLVTEIDEKFKAYELIKMNRAQFGRPIYMTFEDLLKTSGILDTDFFIVSDKKNEILASAILYRSHKSIVNAVFWGDNEKGRPQRAMDFCTFNLWNYYKNSGYKYIDLGISTENGIPNEGLLRFKETHESSSSLRYNFVFLNNA